MNYYRVGYIRILNGLTESYPVSKRCNRVESQTQEHGQGHSCSSNTLVLVKENCSKEDGDSCQMDNFVLRETLEIIDDDPDICAIECQEDRGLIQSVP